MKVSAETLVELYKSLPQPHVKQQYDELFSPLEDDGQDGDNNPWYSEEDAAILDEFLDGRSEHDDDVLHAVLNGAFRTEFWRHLLPESLHEVCLRSFDNRGVDEKLNTLTDLCLYVHWKRKTAVWSPAHLQERLFVALGVEAASHLIHGFFPYEGFPIQWSSELSGYRQLKESLDKLQIDVALDRNLMEVEVWRGLSFAIEQFRTKHDLEYWQMWGLVYDFVPRLTFKHEPYPDRTPRVWIVATNSAPGQFEEIDAHGPENVGGWAINPKARRGDVAIMYCTTPRSAFTSVYRCESDAYYDPFGGWNNYRAEISDRIAIPWIRISEMKADPVLGQWRLVNSNLQGLLKHEVPGDVWKRVIEIVSSRDETAGEQLAQYGSAAEGVRSIKVADERMSETEFESRLAIPLLCDHLGWTLEETLKRQVEMQIKAGSGRPKRCFADFVGYQSANSSRATLVIESKRRIRTNADLETAKLQAESYAGRARCDRFAVASPEGLWIYELRFPGDSTLLASIQFRRTVAAEDLQRLNDLIGYKSLRERFEHNG